MTDFVRMRHGNAVWHLVTGREALHQWVEEDDSIVGFTWFHTECEPNGYCFEGPRTEVVTAEHPPGRLCLRCAKGMEEAA